MKNRTLYTLLLCLLATLPLAGQQYLRLEPAGQIKLPVVVHQQMEDGTWTTDTIYSTFFMLNGGYGKAAAIRVEDQENMTALARVIGGKDTQVVNLKPVKPKTEEGVTVYGRQAEYLSGNLPAVGDVAIFAARKAENIQVDKLAVDKSSANPRQIYGVASGLNITESDAGNLQLNLGGRGLNPNRTSNFNTRQNGYDISADPLGYPESYYTPLPEILSSVQLIRGAAALQYGPQFGGMVNFVTRMPDTSAHALVTAKLTNGSYGYRAGFASVEGRAANNRLSYMSYGSYRRGDGWRPNSSYSHTTAGIRAIYDINEKWQAEGELTHMHYLAQLPGGLTDAAFLADPRQSTRHRNWFNIDWNLASASLRYEPNYKTRFRLTTFGLMAHRQAVGILNKTTVADYGQDRDLICGKFNNMGAELRGLRQYSINMNGKSRFATIVAGARVFNGNTQSMQGIADEPNNFLFKNSDRLEGSNYHFNNLNIAAFAENLVYLADAEKYSVAMTTGVRHEYIATGSNGYYTHTINDYAGNIIDASQHFTGRQDNRHRLLAGAGLMYARKKGPQAYLNFCQNYRPVNFSDLAIRNPNLRIDQNIRDESGHSMDLGLRSQSSKVYRYDVNVFMLRYNNRIGDVLMPGDAPTYVEYRYRTNAGDAVSYGVEYSGELALHQFIAQKNKKFQLYAQASGAFVEAHYTRSPIPGVKGKRLEYVPAIVSRSALRLHWGKFEGMYLVSYTSEQYSEATNARFSPQATAGVIPAYMVHDASLGYNLKQWKVQLSANNLLDARYFTRRTESYPGPGIITAEPRTVVMSVQYRIKAL